MTSPSLAVHVLIALSSYSLAPSTLQLLSQTGRVPYSGRLPTATKTNEKWITMQKKISEFLPTSVSICTEFLIKSASYNSGK